MGSTLYLFLTYYSDLVASVEELRNDVLNKKCRVNLSEVESMALALSNISKSLADLKGIPGSHFTLQMCKPSVLMNLFLSCVQVNFLT